MTGHTDGGTSAIGLNTLRLVVERGLDSDIDARDRRPDDPTFVSFKKKRACWMPWGTQLIPVDELKRVIAEQRQAARARARAGFKQ